MNKNNIFNKIYNMYNKYLNNKIYGKNLFNR